MRIGIYGGSFNPPHKGHTYSAAAAFRQLGLGRLLVIPSGAPPHKTLPPGSPGAERRLEMVKIAFRDIAGCEVSDIEIRRRGESYTIDTLRELSSLYPEDDFYLIVGADMFLTLRRWKDSGEILRLASPAVTLRPGGEGSDIDALTERERAELRALGTETELIRNSVVEISSSELRRGLPGREYTWHIDERVYSYIIENGLYGAKPNFDYLRFEAYKTLPPERRLHVAGCELEAARLAARWGADADEAREAAILHDITKALPPEEQLALCEKYAIPLEEYMREAPKVLHGHTAAELASEKFHVSDDVKAAIKWHTTANAGMSLLGKIIYVADTIEPNRGFDGVGALRELAYRDLDEAVLACMETVMEELVSGGREIAPVTLEAAAAIRGKTKANQK
ncbi:MAG: nicotinate (nicotinamide) nucleotide adenylyltransferase [Oscillospiraceae bacterium]|nr:nicotinate (nicotinamide) nucleotide adenylyltransferase [Oscillospiraceae bacterium]